MRLWNLNSYYREPEHMDPWTAGLIGGVLGMLVMGIFWYLQAQSTTRQRTSKRLRLSRHGQAPDRSHIQLFSHPARQEGR